MAVNHYSADSAPRSCISLHLCPPKTGYPIPLEITCFPLSISIKEVTAPSVYVLADNASAYVGHGRCDRRLAVSPALHAKPTVARISPNPTFLD